MPAGTTCVAIGRRLPEVEEGTWFRTPCLRVRKKSFCRMKEDGETLVVRVVDLEDKEALLRSRPRRLLHDAALRRLRLRARAARGVDPRQLGELIEDAWRLSRAQARSSPPTTRRAAQPVSRSTSSATTGPAGRRRPVLRVAAGEQVERARGLRRGPSPRAPARRPSARTHHSADQSSS